MHQATAPLTSSYVTREELLATFDDRLGVVREVVAGFLSRCPILLEQIRAGLREGNAGAISFAAHNLKGSIGYFAHGDVYAAARRIEQITAAELPLLPTLLQKLEQQLGELTRYLEHEC